MKSGYGICSEVNSIEKPGKEQNMIPEKFKERMKLMLGGEYEPFMAALVQERYQALRVNPLKVDRKEFAQKCRFRLAPFPGKKTHSIMRRKTCPARKTSLS